MNFHDFDAPKTVDYPYKTELCEGNALESPYSSPSLEDYKG